MKNFKMLMLTAAICLTAAPFFNSCDETDPTPPADNSDFPGVYRLTSFGINDEDSANPGTYIPATADLNGDLTESHDLTAESSCYGESYIRFNSDHTYGRYYTYDNGGTCTTGIREAGVWNRVGDVITISSSSTNGTPPDGLGMEDYTMDFNYSGGTITGSREETDNFVGSGFGTGKVDFTYVKEVITE